LPNGDIVSGSSDLKVKAWDSTTGTLKMTIPHIQYYPKFLATLPNGYTVIVSEDRSFRIRDSKYPILYFNVGHQIKITAGLAILPNGDIVFGSEDKIMRIYSSIDGSLKFIVNNYTEYEYSPLATHPNGYILSGSGRNIKIWSFINETQATTDSEYYDY
jgi:WD40 repeat protein